MLAMEYINCVIIDDEKQSVELLETLLQRHCKQVKVLGRAYSVKSGIALLEEVKPQLVFLDIAMPDGDGFHLLTEVAHRGFEVVFVTAYNQHALRAFEFSALHYLLKPIDIDELQRAVQRFSHGTPVNWSSKSDLLKQNLAGKPKKLVLAHRLGYDFVEIDEVIRIEGEDNYSRFYFKNRKSILVSKPLGEYEKLLQDENFFRVHKRHLVNLSSLESFERGKQGTVFLNGGHRVPLSYRRKDDFMDRLKNGMVF